MLKLKPEYQNTKLYIPFTNSNTIGKFIPEGLYEKLNEKYPEYFELVIPSRIVGGDETMLLEPEVEIETTLKKKLESDETTD